MRVPQPVKTRGAPMLLDPPRELGGKLRGWPGRAVCTGQDEIAVLLVLPPAELLLVLGGSWALRAETPRRGRSTTPLPRAVLGRERQVAARPARNQDTDKHTVRAVESVLLFHQSVYLFSAPTSIKATLE